MNYLGIYKRIMVNSEKERHLPYKEKHHYIPRSIFSKEVSHLILDITFDAVDDKDNIRSLSLREHFVAHLLLVKIFEHKNENCFQRMVYAAHQMKSRINNSRQYEWFRSKYSDVHSKYLTGKPSRAKGYKWTKEQLLNKKTLSGRTYEEQMGKEKAERLKKIRSVSSSGRKLSEVARRNMSKPKSEEHKAKLRKPKSERARRNMSTAQKKLYANGYTNPAQGKPIHPNAKKGLIKSHVNKVWVTNGIKSCLVDKSDLESYLVRNWCRGKLWTRKEK